MKSKRKAKRIVLPLLAFIMTGLCLLPQNAQAIESKSIMGKGQSVSQEIVPFADELVVSYRTIDEVRYKRRWNATKGRWHDRYWVPVGEEFSGP